MRWEGREGSDNVEDRRGRGGGGLRVGLPLGGGLGGIVLLLVISALTGTNPLDLLTTTDVPVETGAPTGPVASDDDPQARFISVVLKDAEDTWQAVFRARGETYELPVLVLYDRVTESGCGVGQAETGPFYCPEDRKVYLDLSFFRELDQRFGAPGDFAQAYVVAHEVGHHVQTLLGTSDRVRAARQRGDERQANRLSVRLELQADCYAGVWGASASRRGLLDAGDVEEGLQAAAAIGDDRLQQMGQGRVVPETFTHGSSADRVMWLRRGLEEGTIAACDTFGASGTR
jgi:predicted metalloprotease